MARGKGTANLAASLEVLAGAPLDARDVCPTVADLYVAANWPYKYIGMKTTVQATGDTYRLVNLDVTQESSWVLDGGGSGGTTNPEYFTILSTAWVSNTGADASNYPYVANITTSLYSDTFIPSELLLLGADVNDYLTASEQTAIAFIDQYAKFTGSSIRLRAVDFPDATLTLVVRR